MDEDPVEWGKRLRRRNALRILMVGIVIAVAGGAYWYSNRNWGLASIDGVTITHRGGLDPRVVGGAAFAVGAMLAIAAIVLLARSSRTPPPHDD